MTKADIIFKENIRKIMEEGVFSENARPRYKDGNVANSKYVTGAFAEYDLSKGSFLLQHLDLFQLSRPLRKFSGFTKTRPMICRFCRKNTVSSIGMTGK